MTDDEDSRPGEWIRRRGDDLVGTHPLTGQSFQIRRVWDLGFEAEVWLDDKRLRRFEEWDAALDFVQGLVDSEFDRRDEEDALKTPAEHAADLAEAIDKQWLYRMTRPVTDSLEEFVNTGARAYSMLHGIDVVRQAVPLVKEPQSAKLLSAWIDESGKKVAA